MAVIPKPAYPNVPKLPGVPALPRSPNFPPVVQAVLGFVEGVFWQKLLQAPAWGLYDPRGGVSGDAGRCRADSVLSFDFRAESKVSDFPVEEGSFASYNKVRTPNSSVIRLTKGGTLADRTKWLQGIDNVYQSQTLCHVVTPEKVYYSVTIESYDYSRRAQGTENFLVVDVRLKEVRQVKAAFSTVPLPAPQNPAAASSVNGGKVQPTKPVPSLIAQALKALGVN